MESTPTPSSSAAPNAEVQGWLKKNRLWIFIGALFLVSNLGIYFYQRYQLSKLRSEAREIIEKKGDLAAQLAQHSNERLADALVKPLVWGIRGEMMRGNKELVDHFITSLVQESDIQLVAIVDMTGMVYLCTDKKFENRPVIEVLPTMPREVVKAGVQTASVDKVVGTAPILGDAAQLGVLYFEAKGGDKMAGLLKSLRENPYAEPEEDKK